MLDIAYIRENADIVKAAIHNKRIALDLDELLQVDQKRRRLTTSVEQLRARRNRLASSISEVPAEARPKLIAESHEMRTALGESEKELLDLDAQFSRLMYLVPSVPAEDVPIGFSEAENREVARWGEPPKFDFAPKDHVELSTALGIVDFERPRKFAGSRSYALKGDGMLLEQAVLRFALDTLVSHGFVPVSPPVLVRDTAMLGTGYFPLGYEEAYAMEKDGLYLTGTSEVGLVSLHMGELLTQRDLPIRYAGLSYCFRREAGASGKDTKGLYRVHQFTKVEQVVISENDVEASQKEHYRLLRNSQIILEELGIPHRVALACTGEIGLGQVRKHEVESWMPSRNAYCETHSCSTFHDFQARRLNIRYREEGGKSKFAHTLNNTAIASPRILIPLLENYQCADGSVVIPTVLRPYLGGKDRLEMRIQAS
jgi:seryl-tRNA synthetase